MVWYQTESLSDFIKLYGKITGVLEAGVSYTFIIDDNFDSTSIGSNKSIYLSEVGQFGGKNMVLPYMFLGMAGVLLIILLMFVVCYCIRVRGKDRTTADYLNSLTY
jgi:flagellar biogenesis protein FliO